MIHTVVAVTVTVNLIALINRMTLNWIMGWFPSDCLSQINGQRRYHLSRATGDVTRFTSFWYSWWAAMDEVCPWIMHFYCLIRTQAVGIQRVVLCVCFLIRKCTAWIPALLSLALKEIGRFWVQFSVMLECEAVNVDLVAFLTFQ